MARHARSKASLARAAAAVAALVASGALAGCGDDDGAVASEQVPAEGCGEVRRDRIDPGSATHLLVGADDPGGYRTEPPTSGPHIPGAVFSGVLDEPLSRPEQVGHLEFGGILIQHRDLGDDELAVLRALAGGPVAVAPNPDLPAPVVATAWLHSLSCGTPDHLALGTFAEVHRGLAPGSDG